MGRNLGIKCREDNVMYQLSNVLIDALPESLRKSFVAQLRHVPLPVLTPLYEPYEVPKYAHFLTSGVASIVTMLADGSITEIGTVSREGMPQATHLLGSVSVPTRCFMQVAGTGYRMEFKQFQRLFATEEALRHAVLGYAQYQSLLLGQLAACNRFHEVQQRLARWLLMIEDRTGMSEMKLTQEFLAQMIGTQRTTVSSVASLLQSKGLILYTRGCVTILDRAGLKAATCECYPATRKLLDQIYGYAGQKVLERSVA